MNLILGVKDLLKQYEKENNYITIQYLSIIKNPELAERYGISSRDNAIVVSSKDRKKMLISADLYKMDFATLEIFDITEQKVTNAIMETTILEVPNIYFLTGHNESYETEHYYLLQTIVNELNKVNFLDLLVIPSIPEDCNLLIITTPKVDWREFEIEPIVQYIRRGGNIFLLYNTAEERDYPNMQKILDEYGIRFPKGIVLEKDNNKTYYGDNRFLFPGLNEDSNIVSKIIQTN